jgi:hypothetical protein
MAVTAEMAGAALFEFRAGLRSSAYAVHVTRFAVHATRFEVHVTRFAASTAVRYFPPSGLGKEIGGEGLIGLTRAFQYAGAQSAMASLWKISDRTTAELMARFCKHH